MEFTIKVINTPEHSLFPMGRSYYFNINSDQIFQELYDMMDSKIKETYIVPDFLTFTLLTNKKKSIRLNDKINSTFTKDHILDIIDRDENIFYLYFHTYK